MDCHFYQATLFNNRTGELNAESDNLISKNTRSDIAAVAPAFIRRCHSLNSEIASWLSEFRHSSTISTAMWATAPPSLDYENAVAFPGRIDEFENLWVAVICNMMGCARLILASIVVRCTAWLDLSRDYRTTATYAAASKGCISIIGDIISSVPYHLAQIPVCKSGSISSSSCRDNSMVKALGGSVLMWPLSCILGQDYLTESQHIWAKGRLKFIASELGIKSASSVAEVIYW